MRFILALFAAACGVIGFATAGEESSQISVELGQADFERHCAACHGLSAEGSGPVSQVLIRRPPDLTRLAARNNGTFPAETVRQVIDGRGAVQAHGPREMPVWGKRFSWPEDDESGATRRIANIVAYLRTLQRPAGD